MLNTSIGANEAWSGGLLKITSGSLVNETVAIINNISNNVYISTPFTRDDADALVGASVSVLGGPLKSAKVFHIQPKSIADLVAQGTVDFVFINPITYTADFRGCARDSITKGARNQKRHYELQVMCSVPFATGGTTASDALDKQTRIYDITEQVMAKIHAFLAQAILPIDELGAQQAVYGLMDREGGGATSEISVIETAFSLNL